MTEMATKTERLTSDQALKVFNEARQARRKLQTQGGSWSQLANLANREAEAWAVFERALRREWAGDDKQWKPPARPN